MTFKQDKILIPISQELQEICKEISEMNYSEVEWRNIESDDMFQKSEFEGGFDTTENAFTFSYYNMGNEYWFQLKLEDVKKINEGQRLEVQGTFNDALR